MDNDANKTKNKQTRTLCQKQINEKWSFEIVNPIDLLLENIMMNSWPKNISIES